MLTIFIAIIIFGYGFYVVTKRVERRDMEAKDASMMRELNVLRGEEARVKLIEILEALDLCDPSILTIQAYKHEVKVRRLLHNMGERFHGNWL